MPTPLPIWVRSTQWKPASPGGGSNGFSVECPTTGELGHGKPTQMAREVLASLLADRVGVLVPPAFLASCEDRTIAVSKLFGARSLDIPTLKTVSPADHDSELFRAALRSGSGLLPFHAWLGTGDHKDEHVVVRPVSEGVYEVASIDFAIGAFEFGSAVVVPPGPPSLVADGSRDPTVIEMVVASIESVTDQQIGEIVNSLPDEVLPRDEKDRISSRLIERKTAVRNAFAAAGWLPSETP